MLERMPMEIQMLLCHRVNQSMRDRVRVSEVRVAVDVIRDAFSTTSTTRTKNFLNPHEDPRSSRRSSRRSLRRPSSSSSSSKVKRAASSSSDSTSLESLESLESSSSSSWVFEKMGRSLLEFLRELLVKKRRTR